MPEPRTVVFPAKQAEIIDNWHVVGLRATGSCDYTVSDLFVPEEFTYATENARPERRGALAQRWLIEAARDRSGRPIADRLYVEILEASRGTGVAVRRREDLHRMAEANRAFVHYRW